MTKFLIAILLFATGVKHISNCFAFDYNRYDFAELTLPDEESEQEKGDQGKSKNESEDKMSPHSIPGPFFNTPTTHLQVSLQQEAYLGFVNSPNTPPPDRS